MSDWWSEGQAVVADASGKVASGKLDSTLAALVGGDSTTLHVHNVAAGTPVNAVASTLTTALTGANNDLVFTAATKGVVGDEITIEYVDPGEETETEAVSVDGTAISVTLRSVSSVLSTATEVKTAIDGDATAHALVTVANAGGNDGTGVVTAMSATPLASGVDGTVGEAGALLCDASYLYVCKAANTTAGQNWRRVSLGSAF